MRPIIFIRQSSFPYSLTHPQNPSSVGNSQQTENSISFHKCGHHLLPILPPLQHTCSKPQGNDNDQSTDICLWMSPLPGLPFLCLLGTAEAGQECLCLGFAQVPATAGLRGALSATRKSCTQATPSGASSPQAGLPSHRPSAWGRDWHRHTLENTRVQGAVDPRSHHQLQKDPATRPKQVTLLQCFPGGQEQPESGDTVRVWAPGIPAGPGAGK